MNYFEAAVGKWKIASSAGTLASALSMIIFCLSGSPLRPDSIDVGIKTPPVFPSLFSIICLDLRHALKSTFRAHFARPLLHLDIGQFNLSLIYEQLACKAERLKRSQSIRAPLSFDIF